MSRANSRLKRRKAKGGLNKSFDDDDDGDSVLTKSVPPVLTVQFGMTEKTVSLDIDKDDTIGALRRRLIEKKLIPEGWAEARTGGGAFAVSDLMIGRNQDAKFEPHDALKTMHDLRYDLKHDPKLVVHIRPSIPAFPLTAANADVLKHVKEQLLALASDGVDAMKKAMVGLPRAQSLERGSSSRNGSGISGGKSIIRHAEMSKWVSMEDALALAEIAIMWRWDPTAEHWTHTLELVCIDTRPFSEGQLRYAHYCRLLSDDARGYVAKYAKDKDETRRAYFEDVRMQSIASHMAVRFSAESPPKRVVVVEAAVLEFPLRRDDECRVAGLESVIEGVSVDAPFRKYNNNTGWKTEQGVRNTPQAFSHFTYEASHHQMLVVDIQGVAKADHDIYTDPQIHTVGGVGFGVGNHGQAGIDKFFESHQCNPVCAYFGLPHIDAVALSQRKLGGTAPRPKLDLDD